ncbi:MAG: TVP38/TMEM64 family protein [Clostridia bacterium]|nr:TVP38/TMEM64 family protein [Clostridia bacterium]
MSDKKTNKLFQSKELKPTKTYSKKISWTVIILALILLLILTAVGTVLINRNFTNADDFKKLVEENYLLSVLIMMAVCAIQVMVALIPGELVEIASGYAFGAFWGTVYCLAGILIGSITVILFTRLLGRRFIESICPREKIDSISWINEPRKLHFLTALLFFIPGTPKDLITYAVGLTKMSIPTYILISSLARLPSIIISTLSGGALGESKFGTAIIFISISAITGVVGYLIYSFISKRNKKQ